MMNSEPIGQHRPIAAPNYGLLSNVVAVFDATGMRPGKNNSYGQTTSSGVLTTWKGISPGSTSLTFAPSSASGNCRIRRNNGVWVLMHNGVGTIRSGDAATTYDYMSYNATFSDLKWTVHVVARFGWGSAPNEFFGFFGNNASSQSQKGIYEAYDGRTGISITDMVRTAITKGTSGFISTSNDNNKMTPNEWHVFTFTFDGSLSAADRQKFYIDKTNVPITVTSSSTAVVTTPTRVMEIFGVGNGTLPGRGAISHIVFQSGVESGGTQDAFIDTLLPFVRQLNEARPEATEIYHVTPNNLTDYYFPTFIGMDPTTPGTVMKIFRKSLAHIVDAGGALYYEKSTDWGKTWSAPAVFYDPDGAGNLAVGDSGGGYDSNGRLWVFCDVRTTTGTNMLPYTAKCIYTDDNAATSPTVTDITANLTIPSGEDAFAFRGNVIETSSGRIMAPYYTAVPATFATSSNQIIYTDDNGSTFASIQVRASGATYRNEGALIEVSDGGTTRIINQVRDEVSNEFRTYSSTDDGDNWTDDGAQSFGESFTTASPGYWGKSMINGVSVVEFMYPDRGSGTNLKVVYQKESSLASAPLTFDLDTKVTMWGETMGYGSHFHPYNTLFGIGTFYNGTATTENRLVTAYLGTSHLPIIISELGL